MTLLTKKARRRDRGDKPSAASELRKGVDDLRRWANSRLNGSRRTELGQFLTPPDVALFMASMFSVRRDAIRLVEPAFGYIRQGLGFTQFIEWNEEDARGMASGLHRVQPEKALGVHVRRRKRARSTTSRPIKRGPASK